jgi:ribose 5-phosphate isomerase B
MNVLNLSIGSDHAGYDLKEWLKGQLTDLSGTTEDYGTNSSESTDYPDYAHAVAESVGSGKADLGILICGSANGVCMTANKHQSVRAAICWTPEIARLARLHNDANVLCIPARFLDQQEALLITKEFLSTEFEGGRHERRVNKIPCV